MKIYQLIVLLGIFLVMAQQASANAAVGAQVRFKDKSMLPDEKSISQTIAARAGKACLKSHVAFVSAARQEPGGWSKFINLKCNNNGRMYVLIDGPDKTEIISCDKFDPDKVGLDSFYAEDLCK